MSSDISSLKKTNKTQSRSAQIGAEEVADYLRAHPEFFVDRDSLLAELSVPHESGKAISLLERQVTILRERSIESRHTLNILLENARYNDQLFNVTRNLILTLLEEEDLDQVARLTEANLATQPGIDACTVTLLQPRLNGNRTSAEEIEQRFPSLFRRRNALCQAVDREAASLLFPGATVSIRSAALCPVCWQDELIAILAVGNQAQDYFTTEMETLFLDFIAEVLGAIIHRNARQ